MAGEEQLNVWKNSAVLKEVVVTSATTPVPFRIRAYERGTTNLLKLNNTDYIDVPLSLIKETVNVRISKGKDNAFAQKTPVYFRENHCIYVRSEERIVFPKRIVKESYYP